MSDPAVCEHTFVTAQGFPLTRFRRAIQHRVTEVEPTLLLGGDDREQERTVLSLVELMAAQRDDLFERPALRWHARLELEVPGLTLEESALALSGFLTLRRVPADGTAEEALGPSAPSHVPSESSGDLAKGLEWISRRRTRVLGTFGQASAWSSTRI